jgi:hypothetical protein
MDAPRFTKDGHLIIPITKRQPDTVSDEGVRYVVDRAFCPKGCDIMDAKHLIHGYPGLRIKFRRPGVEGEFVISAIEGDFDKLILSGSLETGVKDELFCPHCDAPFATLVNCNCSEDADMVAIGLTPELDFNNAVTFCNVTGCGNGAFVRSGDVLRHVRLEYA